MASVASGGASPFSGYEYVQTDGNGDSDESSTWNMVPMSSSAGTGSVGFFPSPVGSMGSWAVIGHNSQMAPSPQAPSPLNLDFDQQTVFSTSAYTDQSAAFTSAQGDSRFLANTLGPDGQDFVTPAGLMFNDPSFTDLSALFTPFPSLDHTSQALQQSPLSQQSIQHQVLQTPSLDIPQPFQSSPDVPPWDPTNLKTGHSPIFVIEDPSFVSPSPPFPSSPSASPPASASPRSPIHIKQESGSSDRRITTPISIRKVRGDARVQKKKKHASSESPTSSIASAASSSKFLIVTPDSVNAHAGKPNPFECFDAMRPSQRGRKGPLANDTKQNALQVRRLGACFCCHARKVKCDKERPCRNCTKLTMQVPQVICWQFQDFLPVLFPDFIRGHFRKDEMSRFINENIAGFTVDGTERLCNVELFSGPRFSTTFSIAAKFFTAKTTDVLQHWHMTNVRNAVELQPREAVPIGLETEGSSRRDELRKKVKEYIQSIIQEPQYAEQVTDSLRSTTLPKKVLRIVQNYSYRCDSPIVKRALSIYAMHYVMTRHMCLTRQSIINLGPTKMVPQNMPWVTPRVLNRQIKAAIDELMMKEMQSLFDNFSKSLKPKSRKEWAPCLAAFLVLTLFMESVETAADGFVLSQNEVDLRSRHQPKYKRSFALNINNEVENLPFKQFAYQFHQIYQTHTKDASTKSFNPLLDDTWFEQGEIDRDAMEMVWQLRKFVTEPQHWSELDFLCADPTLRNDENENHPFPRDISFNYTGRLLSKFLLSFTDESYIFGPA